MTALPLPIRICVRFGLLVLLGLVVVWLLKVLFLLAAFALVGYLAWCGLRLLSGERPPAWDVLSARLTGAQARLLAFLAEAWTQLRNDLHALGEWAGHPFRARAQRQNAQRPGRMAVREIQPSPAPRAEVPISKARVVWWTCVEMACGSLVGFLAVLFASSGTLAGPLLGLQISGGVLLGAAFGVLVSLSRPRQRRVEQV